jgi:hypothetical protein
VAAPSRPTFGGIPLYDDATGVTLTEGPFSDAFQYNVDNGTYLYTDDWGILRRSGDLTLALWLQNSIDAAYDIISKRGPGGSTGVEYLLTFDGTDLYWGGSNGVSYGLINSGATLNDGIDHLLVVDFHPGTNVAHIYLDNALIRTGTVPALQSATGGFNLFGRGDYPGLCYGVGKWDRLWTPTERASYYNAGAGVALVAP